MGKNYVFGYYDCDQMEESKELDINKVITEPLNFTEERKQELDEIVNFLSNVSSKRKHLPAKAKRVFDIIYTLAKEDEVHILTSHYNLTPIEKKYVLANTVFNNSTCFISYLKGANLDIAKIVKYYYLLRRLSNKENLTPEEDNMKKILCNNLFLLSNKLRNTLGYVRSEIILNKIILICAYEKDLIEKEYFGYSKGSR